MKRVFDHDFIKRTRKLSSEGGLEDLLSNSKIANRQKDAIKRIFHTLFEESQMEKSRKSIIYSDNFNIYFSNQLDNKGILFRDIIPVLEKTWIELEVHINQWLSDKKEGYLIEILNDIDVFESRERFEKVTLLWILLVNRGIRSEFILTNWIQLVSQHQVRLEEFYGTNNSFFESIFLPTKTPFLFDTYAIRLLLRSYIDKVANFYFPLSQRELQRIAIKRLTEYIDSRHGFDIRVFHSFYYNCWKGKTGDDHVIILKRANKLVRKYINRFPDDYLRFVIRSKYGSHLDGEYVFEPFAHQYFASWDAFGVFLGKRIEANPEFEVMMGYFKEFKARSFESFNAEKVPWIVADKNGNSILKYFTDQTFEKFVSEMETLRSKL